VNQVGNKARSRGTKRSAVVSCIVAWQATYVLSLSNGQSESFTIPGARSNVFVARHQVRESQAVVAQARGN